MIRINGTITLAPGALAGSPDIVLAIIALIEASRAEDGRLVFALAQDLSDPDRLIIHERWRDDAASPAHFRSEHMAGFQKGNGGTPTGSTRTAKIRDRRRSTAPDQR